MQQFLRHCFFFINTNSIRLFNEVNKMLSEISKNHSAFACVNNCNHWLLMLKICFVQLDATAHFVELNYRLKFCIRNEQATTTIVICKCLTTIRYCRPFMWNIVLFVGSRTERKPFKWATTGDGRLVYNDSTIVFSIGLYGLKNFFFCLLLKYNRLQLFSEWIRRLVCSLFAAVNDLWFEWVYFGCQ